jgi:hypothetical protein
VIALALTLSDSHNLEQRVGAVAIGLEMAISPEALLIAIIAVPFIGSCLAPLFQQMRATLKRTWPGQLRSLLSS